MIRNEVCSVILFNTLVNEYYKAIKKYRIGHWGFAISFSETYIKKKHDTNTKYIIIRQNQLIMNNANKTTP